MTRLSRKKRTDIVLMCRGGLFDVLDDYIKHTWRINDAEYDFISERATDEELELLFADLSTYEEKRKAIKSVNSLLEKYLFYK